MPATACHAGHAAPYRVVLPLLRPAAVLTAGLLALWSGAGCSPIPWRYELAPAMRDAQRTGRLVFVHYYEPLAPGCVTMEQEVFANPAIQALLSEMICVRQFWSVHLPEVDRLGLATMPGYVVYRPDGSVAHRDFGLKDFEEMRDFLKQAKLRR